MHNLQCYGNFTVKRTGVLVYSSVSFNVALGKSLNLSGPQCICKETIIIDIFELLQ